mgnify:FL=1
MVYLEIANGYEILPSSLNRAILTIKNPFVDAINDALMYKYLGEAIEYLSCDETLNENHQVEYISLLNILTPNGLPLHRLFLKPNAVIILLINLDPTERLWNGTRLIVKFLSKKCHSC